MNIGNNSNPFNFFVQIPSEMGDGILASTITTGGNVTTSEWYNLAEKRQVDFDRFMGVENAKVVGVYPVRAIFSGTHTHAIWSDGVRTSVRCLEGDTYDREHAVAMCIAHRVFGSKKQFKGFVEDGVEQLSVAEEKERIAEKEAKKDKLAKEKAKKMGFIGKQFSNFS